MEFQAACSAAGPKHGDYTQWVRWRAPTEETKIKKQKTGRLTRMAARVARNSSLYCLSTAA